MELNEILESLKSGKITTSKARKLLSLYAIDKIENIAQIDTSRQKRTGIPEVIFAENKKIDEIKKIIQKVLAKGNFVLISRINKDDYAKIIDFSRKKGWHIEKGRNSTSLVLYKKPIKKTAGKIGIITAGTSDIGIAEEARLMCEVMNCLCICSYDVGIAGLHRIFPILKKMIKEEIDAIIVIAGMEGALATLVASVTDVPVIGVPTSVGYGYGGKGVTALASMLQSCALGLSVVNIDNGIGAGAVAANIVHQINKKMRKNDKRAR